MPEIAEVARIVHFLKKNLVGKTLASVTAQDDANVFGKVGTSGAEFQKSLTGKKVVDAGQQGKYFWLIMSSPPHPLFHFGMTGWVHIRGQSTMKFKSHNVDEVQEWPPRFWKFHLETTGSPKVEVAFTDSRRFARIRLVDCAAADIRKTSPLKENGPDPVIDRDLFTLKWFTEKMKSKHVPAKALLLDQANISGIGNWVGDEVFYHAKLHPEQYSDTFSSAQLKQLHDSIIYVCQTAVDLLADASSFPEDWLFKHRWGKGKKDAPTTLPNGEKITFLTVGGRTSCVVPSVQKKTGAVAGDVKVKDEVDDDDVDGEEAKKPKKQAPKKRKAVAADTESDEEVISPKKAKGAGRKKSKVSKAVKKEDTPEEASESEQEDVNGNEKGKPKKRPIESTLVNGKATAKKGPRTSKSVSASTPTTGTGRRRSNRNSGS